MRGTNYVTLLVLHYLKGHTEKGRTRFDLFFIIFLTVDIDYYFCLLIKKEKLRNNNKKYVKTR